MQCACAILLSVSCRVVLCRQKEGWTDGHGVANIRFYKFCIRAQKWYDIKKYAKSTCGKCHRAHHCVGINFAAKKKVIPE
jgi:hypothetical protein